MFSSSVFAILNGKIKKLQEYAVTGLKYTGSISSLTQSPTSTNKGDLYISNVEGTLSNFGGLTVKQGDGLIYNGSSWDKIAYSELIKLQESFIIKDKYSDLTKPTKSMMAYVINDETVGTDIKKKGFYYYDIKEATPKWIYIEISGGSTSGTNDYEDLINKPSINNIELVGNKNLSDLGIDTYDDTQVKTQISNINKAIGDIDGLTIVGVKDLVNAVNKLDLSFMQSIVYNTKDGKKLLTITYKNGNTTDIDITAIITNTNIGELVNVDDSGITDKQVLSYDSATGKYIPITINNSNVLQEAKDYTDKQINTINHVEGKVVDSKPTIVNNSDGTYSITYIKNGASTTTKDTNIWFFYNTGTNTYAQTIFIDGVEVTLSMNGSIDLTDYVNKTTDLAKGFTGNEVDKTKVTTIKELDDLLAIINTSLSKKVNSSDVINDLVHEDADKPLSAKQGKELKRLIEDISVSVTGGGSVILKKSFENVTANTVNKFDSPLPLDNACIINVYKTEKGNTNLNETLEEFKNNTKQDFIKNEDEIIIDDNGAKIKDKYSYKAIFDDTTNIFKTVLDINNFIDISFECEVI